MDVYHRRFMSVDHRRVASVDHKRAISVDHKMVISVVSIAALFFFTAWCDCFMYVVWKSKVLQLLLGRP